MSNDSHPTDILIIGGGIIGAATAYHLSQRGAKVTLVEAALPGHGTSANSFAWLNSANKPPRPYHDLNVAGIAEHKALASTFPAAPWLYPVGGLSWSLHAAGQDELREQATRQAGWGYRTEAITIAQAQELEPGLALDPDRVPEVWYSPDEGWADVPLLIDHLLRAAMQAGATVLTNDPVVAIDHQGGTVHGVRLASGQHLATDALAICAGPRADDVCALLGYNLPLDRSPGLLALTGPVQPTGRCVCHTDAITFRPDPSGGLILAHADDLDSTVQADTPLTPLPPACAEALDRAAQSFPAVRQAGVAAARVGVRPLPRDGVTIAGPIPGFTNARITVTHSGVTLGPLLGKLQAQELLGDTAAQLAPFRPGRFA